MSEGNAVANIDNSESKLFIILYFQLLILLFQVIILLNEKACKEVTLLIDCKFRLEFGR